MVYEKTTVPNPPVGASGEQPQFKETTGSIANTTEEIKCLGDTKQKLTTVDGPSAGGPSLDLYKTTTSSASGQKSL